MSQGMITSVHSSRWDKKKRNVIQSYWLCDVAVALPSTDAVSSAELNTAGWWAANLKNSILALKEAWQRSASIDSVSHNIKRETTVQETKSAMKQRSLCTRMCASLSVAEAYRLYNFSKELPCNGVVIFLKRPEIPFARLTTCLLQKLQTLYHRNPPWRLLMCGSFFLSLKHTAPTHTSLTFLYRASLNYHTY